MLIVVMGKGKVSWDVDTESQYNVVSGNADVPGEAVRIEMLVNSLEFRYQFPGIDGLT